LTRKRFGVSFGPHRFRHAIATTAALRDPASPGLAVGLLKISGPVIDEHYNWAGQSQAAIMFDKAVAQRQGRLRHGRVGNMPCGQASNSIEPCATDDPA
jgi:hypothetical protein